MLLTFHDANFAFEFGTVNFWSELETFLICTWLIKKFVPVKFTQPSENYFWYNIVGYALGIGRLVETVGQKVWLKN